MNETKKIGFGTAAIGRPQYINIKSKSTNKFVKQEFRLRGLDVLEYAYKRGVRYFDTAPGYGMAEQILIDWLKSKNDDSIEIATKWGYSYVADFNPNAKVHEIKDHSVSQLIDQWEKSKELLPNLTTYQIHSATFETGVLDDNDVLKKLLELKQTFNLKMGITTSGSNQVEVLKKALNVEVNGVEIFDTFQVTYNMLDQSLLSISEELNSRNKRIVIKEALANGRVFRNKNFNHYNSLYDSLEEIASKYRVGVDAVALQFCTKTLNPFVVLSGASEKKQLLENLKSGEFEMTTNEIEEIKLFGISSSDYWNERKQLQWN